MKVSAKLLIEILQDNTANVSEKDDAAMDLSEFDDEKVIQFLVEIGSDISEDPLVLGSCGESIGEIWARKNSFDSKSYKSLSPETRKGVQTSIRTCKPEWLELCDILSG